MKASITAATLPGARYSTPLSVMRASRNTRPTAVATSAVEGELRARVRYLASHGDQGAIAAIAIFNL